MAKIDHLLTGKTLQDKRREANMSAGEVADYLGVVEVTVREWECGRRHPHIKHLVNLAELFHCKIDDLLIIVPGKKK